MTSNIPASGYSRIVKVLKIGLPVIGLSLMALAIAWPSLTKKEHTPSVHVDASSPEVTENRMLQPRYVATDEKGQPYEIQAQWGKQHTEKTADLINPHGVLSSQEHGDVQLDADSGYYDMDQKKLDLKGNVKLKSQDGYQFETEVAHVDAGNKIVDSDSPLTGKGPTGTMKSENGFTLSESEEGHRRIHLKGRSQVIIAPNTLKKGNAQ